MFTFVFAETSLGMGFWRNMAEVSKTAQIAPSKFITSYFATSRHFP